MLDYGILTADDITMLDLAAVTGIDEVDFSDLYVDEEEDVD